MKKLYTLLTTCLLLLFVTPMQSIDAGVGHSRSGSSSRSSSSSMVAEAVPVAVIAVVLPTEVATVLETVPIVRVTLSKSCTEL